MKPFVCKGHLLTFVNEPFFIIEKRAGLFIGVGGDAFGLVFSAPFKGQGREKRFGFFSLGGAFGEEHRKVESVTKAGTGQKLAVDGAINQKKG